MNPPPRPGANERGGEPENSSSARLAPRDEVLREISELVREKEHFFLIGFPSLSSTVAVIDAIGDRDWVAYLDHGVETVGIMSGPFALAVLRTCSAINEQSAAVVVAVPKSRATLEQLVEVLGWRDQAFPPNDEHDVLLLQTEGPVRLRWPVLFLDALELIDAAWVAQVRATAIGIGE